MLSRIRSDVSGAAAPHHVSSLLCWFSSVNQDGMLCVQPAQIMGKTEASVFYLMDCPTLELFHYFCTLSDACAAEGVAAGKQSAVSVYRHLASYFYLAGPTEVAALSLLAETEFFHLDHFRNSETVMCLSDMNIVRLKFCPFKGLFRRYPHVYPVCQVLTRPVRGNTVEGCLSGASQVHERPVGQFLCKFFGGDDGGGSAA